MMTSALLPSLPSRRPLASAVQSVSAHSRRPRRQDRQDRPQDRPQDTPRPGSSERRSGSTGDKVRSLSSDCTLQLDLLMHRYGGTAVRRNAPDDAARWRLACRLLMAPQTLATSSRALGPRVGSPVAAASPPASSPVGPVCLRLATARSRNNTPAAPPFMFPGPCPSDGPQRRSAAGLKLRHASGATGSGRRRRPPSTSADVTLPTRRHAAWQAGSGQRRGGGARHGAVLTHTLLATAHQGIVRLFLPLTRSMHPSELLLVPQNIPSAHSMYILPNCPMPRTVTHWHWGHWGCLSLRTDALRRGSAVHRAQLSPVAMLVNGTQPGMAVAEPKSHHH